jgi:hypothetical protein
MRKAEWGMRKGEESRRSAVFLEDSKGEFTAETAEHAELLIKEI